MQKKYLITGANGPLGRGVTGKLRQTDAELILTEAGRGGEGVHPPELGITQEGAGLGFCGGVKPAGNPNWAG